MIETQSRRATGVSAQERRGWIRKRTEDGLGFHGEARGRAQVAPEVVERRLACEGTTRRRDPMSDQPFSSAGPELSGENLRKISSAIVGLYREHFGKGPTAAKTYVLDDLVICVLRDGLTTVEKTLFERGKGDVVREMRTAFQDAVADRFTSTIERLTNRKVVASMSQAHVAPDLTIEVFCLDRPVGPVGTVGIEGESEAAEGA
jgi:uncharacterized protein YbcI